MPFATLAGKPLIATQTLGWNFTSGVNPNQQGFDMEAGHASELQEKIGTSTVSLVIQDRQNDIDLKIDGLYILGIHSSGNPQTRQIVVSDQRWLWPRKHILRRFNIRRRTGGKRLIEQDFLGNIAAVDDVGFAQWSLKAPERPWTAREILTNILSEIGAPGTGFQILGLGKELPVEDLDLDDSFESALLRVLRFIPGANVFIDKKGIIQVFNELDPLNPFSSDKAGPVIADAGWVVKTDNSKLRPSVIRVYFTREFEMRFNAVEGSRQALIGVDQVDNVLPLPDTVTDLQTGEKFLSGTWVTFDKAIQLWRPTIPAGLPDFNRDTIRETWFYGMFNYAEIGKADPRIDWAARISTARNHYRQTYRIRRDILDRLYQIKPYRVAVVDQETGARASSSAWMDYSLTPTNRGEFILGADTIYGLNVEGYSEQLATAKMTPITVQVLDEEQGIVRIAFRGDPLNRVNEVIPSIVDGQPFCDASGEFGPRFRYEKHKDHGFTKLSADHGLAFILTVSEGAPNGTSQLERIDVKPEQIRSLFDGGDKILPAEGPPLDIRILPGMITARFGWIDRADWADRVKSVFGLGRFTTTETTGVDLTEGWTNIDDCIAVARAAAAVAYAAMVDRSQGEHRILLSPDAKLNGTMNRLTHIVSPNGKAETLLSFPAVPLNTYSLFSLLPLGVRREILREVSP